LVKDEQELENIEKKIKAVNGAAPIFRT